MTDSKFTYHLTSYGVFKKSMEQIVKEHALWVLKHPEYMKALEVNAKKNFG